MRESIANVAEIGAIGAVVAASVGAVVAALIWWHTEVSQSLPYEVSLTGPNQNFLVVKIGDEVVGGLAIAVNEDEEIDARYQLVGWAN